MKKPSLLLISVLLTGLLTNVFGQKIEGDPSSPYGVYKIVGDGTFEDLPDTPDIEIPNIAIPGGELLASDKWTIKVKTGNYMGGAVHASWGTILFHAGIKWSECSEKNQDNCRRRLIFDVRPPVADASFPNGYRTEFRIKNTKIADVGINKTDGTPFELEITSDGTGSIFTKSTINGATYIRDYLSTSQNGITSVTHIATGLLEGVTVSIEQEVPKDILTSDSISFGYVEAGYATAPTQSINLAGVSLDDGIAYSIVNLDADSVETTGGDADAFSFPGRTGGLLIKTSDTLAVRFAPPANVKKEFIAYIKLSSTDAPTKYVRLIGSSDFELPIKLSSENTSDEHWYFIQFTRRAGGNLVLKNNGIDKVTGVGEYITQSVIDFGNDSLKWKIVGDWDNYRIVSKIEGQEFLYVDQNLLYAPGYVEGESNPATKDSLINKYAVAEFECGETHGFVRYNYTDSWQLYNNFTTKGGANKYLNDSKKEYAGLYSKNDTGNQLLFIPANRSAIFAGNGSIDFAKIPSVATSVISQVVAGGNLTENIVATLTGADSDAFSLSATSLPATGDSLHITFTPSAKRLYSATLTLTSNGADPVSIALTGDATLDFPLISDNNNQYWYFIQFVRSAEKRKVLESEGSGNYVKQKDWDVNQPMQQWKVIGQWNAYKIVGYDDEELIFNLEDSRMKLAGTGEGHSFKFERDTTAGKWQLYNLNTDDGNGHYYANDHDGKGEDVAMWNANDGGNYLNFIPVNPTVGIDEIAADDTLVAKRYYTLLGVEVIAPSTTGIYIVKEIYASKKTKVYKVLIAVK
ncbi:MAG: hypothetical protein LBM08_13125 [Dysgonamonadaceae bacterium]|jgi:hypothetical protein|nr:hypothetical protein [Dysgonamonadaceae bacterium]